MEPPRFRVLMLISQILLQDGERCEPCEARQDFEGPVAPRNLQMKNDIRTLISPPILRGPWSTADWVPLHDVENRGPPEHKAWHVCRQAFAACYVNVTQSFSCPPEARKPGDLVTAKTLGAELYSACFASWRLVDSVAHDRASIWGSQQHHLSHESLLRCRVTVTPAENILLTKGPQASIRTVWRSAVSHPHVAWGLRTAKPDDSKSQYPGLPELEAGWSPGSSFLSRLARLKDTVPPN